MSRANLKISQLSFEPSKGASPEILERQFIYRKNGEFVGDSEIVISDIKEPIWWNRPLESNKLLKQEKDGLYSYNLPFIDKKESFKTGYNILLGKNSLPIAVHIKFDDTWTSKQISGVTHMLRYALLDALYTLKVPKENLTVVNNDILYNGKKFVADEQRIDGNIFTENMVITLDYTQEAEIFQRLTGKYALTRGITGIIEETKTFTKKQLVDLLITNIEKYLKK